MGKNRYHTGIFVDIFPVDRCPDSFRGLFQFKCLKYQLFMREFIPAKSSWLVRCASKVILGLSSTQSRKTYREQFERELSKLSSNKNFQAVSIEIPSTIKLLLPSDLLDEYIELPFEGRRYSCFAKYDDYLRTTYGNYMQLPPENERVWTHSPILIDFEHNYGEEL